MAHAPERLHHEITADYNDMIYAANPAQIAARREAFIRKWRLKHRAVAIASRRPGSACSRLPACAAGPMEERALHQHH